MDFDGFQFVNWIVTVEIYPQIENGFGLNASHSVGTLIA